MGDGVRERGPKASNVRLCVDRAGILHAVRRTYESERDREREQAVALAAFGPLGLTVAKLPLAYEVDFAVMRGERVVGVAEVKVRSRAYETVLLSLRKVQALERHARCGLIAWLLVAVPEGVYAQRVLPGERLDVRWGGRADRGDWQDREPVVHLPMSVMRRVAEC